MLCATTWTCLGPSAALSKKRLAALVVCQHNRISFDIPRYFSASNIEHQRRAMKLVQPGRRKVRKACKRNLGVKLRNKRLQLRTQGTGHTV